MTRKLIPAALCALVLCGCGGKQTDTVALDADTATAVSFEADSAMQHLRAQCDLGPRTPGSGAHRRCGDYLVAQFQARGCQVTEQRAPLTMWDGKRFECRNITAQYRPEAAERIVLCTHYDSRPWADHDADAANHTRPVLAANDGASGPAVLLEVARKLAELQPQVGVDFVCFDLEDYGAPQGSAGAPTDGSDWCAGSRYWAQHPIAEGYSPQFGVLLDMVGGRGARFAREYYSMQYAAPVVARVWSAAQTAGFASYFLNEMGGAVTDDHLSLNAVGIPTIDIIPGGSGEGFGPTWHTAQDTPDNIDPATLKAVGQTLLQMLADYR